MNDSVQLCPECGLALPAGEDAGCPGCSLRLALSDDSGSARPTPSLPGLKSRFFGDYEILAEIARGGMGVVYRARQLGLNRIVALKMVQSQHLLSDEARLRFQVEIEAVAQLHHPHIVALYESGEHDGAHYFTMRLVEGGDLASQLKGTRPVRELVQLLVKVCRAVHYAHQRGILHRDLKPSNILVDEQGEPHVADFGLAKSLDHDTGFTFASSVLGSPNYMAPEQASGKVRQLSTSVDVYGLGAILYHVLAGVPPFQSKTPIDTLRQVIDRDPVPPRTLNPSVDDDIQTIALKCLRKEPGERYGTTEELAQDLERWLAARPILARPLGLWATAGRWARRHPAVATLAVALAIAVAAIVVGTSLAAMRIRHAEQRADASLRESLLREAASFRLAGELGHRAEGLDKLREAAALGGNHEYRVRLRDELLATLARSDVAFVPSSFSNAASRAALLRIDERFEQCAVVEQGTNVSIRDVRSGAMLHRIFASAPVERIERFSPDGRFLALRHTNSLSIWETATGTRCLLHDGTNNTFCFAPNEPAVLLQDALNTAVLLELPSGRELNRWSSEPSRPGYRKTGWKALEYSRNGRIVAAASGTSHIIELMDAATGQSIRFLTNLNGHILAMCWSRAGGSLAAATFDGRIVSWNPATGAERWSTPHMVAPARSMAYHPRGDCVAVVCEDNRVRFYDDLAQRFSAEIEAAGEQLVFSPDGEELGPVWSRDGWGSIEIQTSPEFVERRVGSPLFRMDDARFSPDGRLLAVGHSDTVYLLNAVSGTRLRIKEDWRMFACAFALAEPHVFVTGAEGILRHRFRYIDSGDVSFSHREVIHAGPGWRALDFSANQKFFAAYNVESNLVYVFDRTLTNQLAVMGPHSNAEVINISPDGRWLTTGARANRTVRLWDVANQRQIFAKNVGVQPVGIFSADGRWLAITGDREFHLLETGTWKPAPSLPLGDKPPILGAAAFSPDSRLLAVVVNKFTMALIDLREFRCVGTLRAPGNTQRRGLAFSADGLRLAAVGPEARVGIWNLRELQKRMKEFGLAEEFASGRL